MPQPATPSPPRVRHARGPTRFEKELAAANGGVFKDGMTKDGREGREDVKIVGEWKLGKMIGKGASGRVKIARHIHTGAYAACKIIPRSPFTAFSAPPPSRMNEAEIARMEKARITLEREIVIMKLIDHPNVMKLEDVHEIDGVLYLILEYVPGGELFDYLVSSSSHGGLSANEASSYFQQLIYALSYCHSFNICHRDLKPENVLLDKDKNVKIADFGMAALGWGKEGGKMLETSCGSPHYASPEIVSGHTYNGPASDIWSCGVILFALITGRLPFDDENIRMLLQKVRSGKYSLPERCPDDARDLIAKMLVVDPEKRIAIADIMKHPFFLRRYEKTLSTRLPIVEPPKIEEISRPVNSYKDIDRELLASLATLWQGSTEKELVEALLSDKQCYEKAFYYLLWKHQNKRLENYNEEEDVARRQQAERRAARARRHGDKSSPRSRPGSAHDKTRSNRESMVRASGNSTNPTTVNTQATQGAPHATRPAPRSPLDIPVPSTPIRSKSPASVGATISPVLGSPGGVRPRVANVMGPRPRSGYEQSAAVRTLEEAIELARPGSAQIPSTTTPPPRLSRTPTYHGSTPNSPRHKESGPRSIDGRPAQGLGLGIMGDGSPRIQVAHEFARMSMEAQQKNDPILNQFMEEVARQFHDYKANGTPLLSPQSKTTPTFSAHGRFNSAGDQNEEESLADHPGSPVPRRVNEKPLPVSPVTAPDALRRLGLGEEQNIGAGSPPHDQTRRPTSRRGHSEGGNSPMANTRSSAPNRRSYLGDGGKLANSPKESKDRAGDAGAEGKKPPRPVSFIGFDNKRKTKPATLKLNQGIEFLAASQSPKVSAPGTPLVLEGETEPPKQGWFGNLFNWKPATCVLISSVDCKTTRAECQRLLESFGATVIMEDSEGFGTLKCRIEMIRDPTTGIMAYKAVRFRVEVCPNMGSQRGLASEHSPRLDVPQAAPKASTNIIFTQEKGAVSTFKTVHGRLRNEWTLDSLKSPSVATFGITA